MNKIYSVDKNTSVGEFCSGIFIDLFSAIQHAKHISKTEGNITYVYQHILKNKEYVPDGMIFDSSTFESEPE